MIIKRILSKPYQSLGSQIITVSYSIEDGSTGGTTIYFGSKKSEVYLCFYEKNYEQALKV
ncbi:hypothetical protein GCM10008934_02040 [Virgibacillus salarius]|nr:replication initiation factor domain-containing protein [Virgibacillus salarius]